MSTMSSGSCVRVASARGRGIKAAVGWARRVSLPAARSRGPAGDDRAAAHRGHDAEPRRQARAEQEGGRAVETPASGTSQPHAGAGGCGSVPAPAGNADRVHRRLRARHRRHRARPSGDRRPDHHRHAADQARHHRIELRRRRQPAHHPRPRQLSRARAGGRHRHARRLGAVRGSRRSHRSQCRRSRRGGARPGHAALRLAGHRRRRQRRERSHP